MAETAGLRALERKGDLDGVIAGMRELVRVDRRVLADPWAKSWCGRRFRHILVAEMAAQPEAVQAASRDLGVPGSGGRLSLRRDDRPERRRVGERFLAAGAEEWEAEMPAHQTPRLSDTALLFCPGLINGMLPVTAFGEAFPELERRLGVRVIRADCHPARGCEANVADILAALERGEGMDAAGRPIADPVPPRHVFVIGYSKGTADALTALALAPEIAPRVRALFAWGGAVGGSYLADDIAARVAGVKLPGGALGEAAKRVLRALCPVVNLDEAVRRLDEFDVGTAIGDLTTAVREGFLAEHGDALDALDVPSFNITAATRAREVPYFQLQGYLDIATVDPDNDMQLTQQQARLPGPMATDLAVLRAHHWDIAYDPFPVRARLGSPNLDHRFPRFAALAAVVAFGAELGLLD